MLYDSDFKSLDDASKEYINHIIAKVQTSTSNIESLENQGASADKTLLAGKTAEQLRLLEEDSEIDFDKTYGKIAGWDNYVARYVKEAEAVVTKAGAEFTDDNISQSVTEAVDQWAKL
jgi:hypothetical protein